VPLLGCKQEKRVKWITVAPIILVVVGLFALFAGGTLASAEEGVANSLGNALSSKWLAVGLITAGALWFASEEGYLQKA